MPENKEDRQRLYYEAVELRLQDNHEAALLVLRRAQRLNPMSRELKTLIKDSEEKLAESKKVRLKKTTGVVAMVQRMMGMQMQNNGESRPDSRHSTWRQEAPAFITDSTKSLQERASPSTDDPLFDPVRYAKQELKRINADYDAKKYDSCRYRCEQTLARLKDLTGKQLEEKDKQNFIANVNSCLGNACLELDQFEEALEAHHTDLCISREHELKDCVARALFNLGRTYARTLRFQEAIDVWEERVPLSVDARERAWLWHEIGRSQMALQQLEQTKTSAENACANALELDEPQLQLEAYMLLGTVTEKLGSFEDSLQAFIKAYEYAMEMGDDEVCDQIQDSVDRLEGKLQGLIDKISPEVISKVVDEVSRSATPEVREAALTALDIEMNDEKPRSKAFNQFYHCVLLYMVHASATV